MPTPDFTAAQVMNTAAALNNDQSRSVYTYAAQLPYLNLALHELEEYYQQNDIPVVEVTSAVIQVDAGATSIGFSPTVPTLPANLVEIVNAWWTTRDGSDWTPFPKSNFLKPYSQGIENSGLTTWAWNANAMVFYAATGNNDVKLDYLKSLFYEAVDENTVIGVINARTFLEYRTASLCAQFIGEDKIRADTLDQYAIFGSDRATGIATKSKQDIFVRRRPFRAAYKRRG